MTTEPVPGEAPAATADGSGDALRVEHISKRFGAVTALHDVNLHLAQGEVLGLLGDNGAGKSTLIKIMCGFQPPSSGRILLEGQEITLKSVDHARSLGIDTVYQDLALINELTVYHNMFLNRERTRWSLLSNRSMRKTAREQLDRIGINLPSVDVRGGQAVRWPAPGHRGGPGGDLERQGAAAGRAAGGDGRQGRGDDPGTGQGPEGARARSRSS